MIRRHSIQILTIASAAAFLSNGFTSLSSAEAVVSGVESGGLVFVATSDEEMDLWRARLADGALQQISATPKQEERWPIWSVEANRLAYVVRNTEGFMRSTVKLLDLETGEESELGPNPDLVQRSHIWSPDGKFVAHTFSVPASKEVFITSSGTAIVDIEKATRVVVSKVERIQQNMMHLEFSSDGERILASGRTLRGAGNDKLWMLKRKGPPRQLKGVPPGIYAKPHFTRDEEKVVFSHQTNLTAKRNVMTLDLTPNSSAKRLASQVGSDDHSPVPSPVRDEVVFVSDRHGSPDLFLVDLGGGVPINLTRDSKGADLSPVWSPDGEQIAFIVVPKNNQRPQDEMDHSATKIRVIDRTGKVLFETLGIMPSWMPAWTGDQPVAARAKGLAKTGAKGGSEGEAP